MSLRVPLRSGLAVMSALALLGLPVVAAFMAVDRYRAAGEAGELASVMDYSVAAGDLVHELQKERGASALYLASGGEEFGDNLRDQHGVTDVALAAFAALVESDAQHLSSDVLAAAQSSLTRLDALSDQRGTVLGVDTTVPEAVAWYTASNTELINASASVIADIGDPTLRSDLAAYVTFVNAKERSGLERAQISSAFARDAFAPGQFATVVSLIAQQEAFLAAFQALASPAVISFFETTQGDPAVAEVDRLRGVALSNPDGGFGQSAPDWFAVMTERIDLLKQVEDLQGSNLSRDTRALEAAAVRDYRIAIPAALLLTALVLALAITIPWSITTKLRTLVGATKRVNAGELDNEPITVHSADELGQLSAAFNTMTATLAATHSALADSAAMVAAQAEVTRVDGAALGQSIDQTSVALDEMKHAIDEIASSAAAAADTARSAVSNADDANEAVAELNRSSDEIAEVLAVVSSIAKKTSLLALNASIEAGRAGPAGRGFGVVADEVGQLAKATDVAAGDIANRIAAIRSSTSGVNTTNDQVTGIIDEINNITENIAAAIEQQTATTTEISRLMEDATGRTESITQSIHDLAESAAEAQPALSR